MKVRHTHRLLSAGFLQAAPFFLSALAPLVAHAQSASGASAAAAQPDETIVMSVFEVNSDDEKGYTASSALTGTRTNEKLENLPNSISVFTASLMADLAIVDFFGAVENGIGVENVYNDTGVVGAPVGASASNQISFRGINSLRQLRDGFVWFVPQDNFNVERIEFVRGPNGTSYGDVDPVGTLNVATKRPSFRRSASVSSRFDNFGSERFTLDVNQPLTKGLSVRVNGVYSGMEQSRERADRMTRAYAGAIRWLPFGNRRTQIDFNIEKGNTRSNLSALHLNDGVSAYVRGSGTNALDANPNASGTQTNGIGMRQIASASGSSRVFLDMGGTLYDMKSTATTIYRNSCILTGSSNATGSDPQNPNRIPLLTVPFDIYPYGQDWSGPSNYTRINYHAYNIELTHTIGENLRLLVATNGQVHDSNTLTMHSGSSALGMNTRAVFIDVNRVLPDPTKAGATIPNPHFEDYFVCYVPVKSSNGAKATGWRASLVHDVRLPFGGSSLRTVAGATYRHERNYNNSFRYALTLDEMARRGITGKAATYSNNAINPIHYLVDGNSYEALVFREVEGGGFYRQGTSNTRYDQTLGSASITSLGSFFKERIHTNAGVSRYYFRQNRSAAAVTDDLGAAHLVDFAGNYIDDPNNYGDVPLAAFKRGYTTNQSYGGVVRVLPWMSLSTGYFQSSLFTESTSSDLRGNPALPLNGSGWEYSMRFNLLNDRVHIAVTNFDTTAENKTLGLSSAAVTELNELLPANKQLTGTGDYRDQVSKGWEVEVQMNMTRQWTLRASYSTSKTNYTRFYPYTREYLALARAEAVSRGLDPDTETQITSQLIADTEGSVAKVRRETANFVTRYSFERGVLKGVNVGTSVRYVLGKPLAALSSGGQVAVPAGKTDTDVITSPFASYTRKVFGYRTTFQMNVNNVFNDRSHQGNNYTWIRYNEPRQFITTVTVNF